MGATPGASAIRVNEVFTAKTPSREEAKNLRAFAPSLFTSLSARRSTSAEPLHEAKYRQAPLTDETWERLWAHAQFQ